MSKDEILAAIRDGVAHNKSQGEISKAIGKSPSYVSKMMQTHGVKPARPERDMKEVGRYRPGPERLNFLRDNVGKFSQSELAKITGVTRQRISQIVDYYKLSVKSLQELTHERIHSALPQCQSLEELCKVIELSPNTVLRYLRQTEAGKTALMRWRQNTAEYKKEQAKQAFIRLAEKLGHTPSQTDINNDPDCPAHTDYYRMFGSLPELAEQLGMVPNRRGGWRKGLRKTHCIHGHELSGDNVYEYQNTKTGSLARICRTCRRNRKVK